MVARVLSEVRTQLQTHRFEEGQLILSCDLETVVSSRLTRPSYELILPFLMKQSSVDIRAKGGSSFTSPPVNNQTQVLGQNGQVTSRKEGKEGVESESSSSLNKTWQRHSLQS